MCVLCTCSFCDVKITEATSISLSLCALYVLSMQAAIQTLQCVCTRLKESGTALAWPPLSRSSLLVSKMNLCYMYMYVLRIASSSFFLGKVTALCVLLPCLNCCLFDLACFFLPSFSSLIKTCTPHVHVYTISSVQLTNMFR